MRHLLSATVILLTLVAPAFAQKAQPTMESIEIAPPSAGHDTQLLVGLEVRRDRFRYHFDNPSLFDTPFLVPHFFEQRYVADNLWAVGTVRYTAGVRWETSAGATPQRTATADDFDTFFDPDGTVLVSGTTGGVSIRSFQITQRADAGHVGPIQLLVGYRFRLDRSDFQLGHKTVTRNGTVIAAADDTSRETTSSQVHEVLVGLVASQNLRGDWQLSLESEFAPATLARLSVQLPDKYPGQDLVFLAKILAGSARVVLARSHGRWPLEVAVDAGHTWSYRSTARLSRDLLSVQLTAGRTWH